MLFCFKMSNLFRTSLYVLILCCGGLVDQILSANPDVCRIKSTTESAAGQPGVRPSVSIISFKLVTYGTYIMWENTTQMRDYLLTPDENCGITVFIRTNDIPAATMIRQGMDGRNIGTWKTECQFIDAPIPSANPTVSFQKLITAVVSTREETIPEEWFNGDAAIAELHIPVLPNSEKFGLSCSIDSSFPYNGMDVDFNAEMDASIHLAGCPDGKYGSSCSSDCTCAEAAACDTFTGCANVSLGQVTESSTMTSTTLEPDISSAASQETHAPSDGTGDTTNPTTIQTQEPSTGSQGASISPEKPPHVPPENKGKGTTPSNKASQKDFAKGGDTQSSACMTDGVRLWTSVFLIISFLLLKNHQNNLG